MKGFDDHLDNYGDPDPGGDFDYDPDPYAGVPQDADPDYTDDDKEPTVIVEGREYATLASGDVVCPECGASRSTGRIADHMASEHSDDDEELGDPRPPGNLPYYPWLRLRLESAAARGDMTMSEFGETWDGPGDDWYPGDDDDDETNADGDRYDETPVQGIFPDIPDDPARTEKGKSMSEKIIEVSREVLEAVESIACTLPGKVFYSGDGEALFLTDDSTYIISVEPPPVILEGFNNGNCTTHSAYLSAEPLVNIVGVGLDPLDTADRLSELEGWSTGWEC